MSGFSKDPSGENTTLEFIVKTLLGDNGGSLFASSSQFIVRHLELMMVSTSVMSVSKNSSSNCLEWINNKPFNIEFAILICLSHNSPM